MDAIIFVSIIETSEYFMTFSKRSSTYLTNPNNHIELHRLYAIVHANNNYLRYNLRCI